MTVTQPKQPSTQGREQAKSSPKALQHTDFRKYYAKSKQPIDLFRQNLRFLARVPEGTFGLGNLAESVTWQEASSDLQLTNVNTQAEMTGTLQLKKPALHQYNLLPDWLSARISSASRSPRTGMLGVVIICEVGWGALGDYTPVWAMRVVPGSQGGTGAEQVQLADGTWTLNLADDLWLLTQSAEDWKFVKGRKTRQQGWRAHEVAQFVCQQYKIPVRTLTRGTAYFDLPVNQTTAVSPSEIISLAYQEETKRTGRTFVMRWGAPDNKFPLGALEVQPIRRNETLLVMREQLIDAALSRSQSPDFATVIEARATLKEASGKTSKITKTVQSEPGIRRYGWVHKIVNYGNVSSDLELEIVAKRSLAVRLAPIRTAEITHPGVATIRRGDALRLQIPEEGYAQVKAPVYDAPKMPPDKGSTKTSAEALAAAERDDPTLFGLPDPKLLSTTGAANNQLTTTDATNMNTAAIAPVADQGIVFVTSVQHTVSSGQYTVDVQTGFVDILDPLAVQAEIDAALRALKPSSTSGASTTGQGVGARWMVTVHWEDDSGLGPLAPPGNGCSGGACFYTGDPVPADGMLFSICSASGTSSDTGTAGQALTPGSVWPGSGRLYFTNPSTGTTVLLRPCDKGAGDSSLPVVNIYGRPGVGAYAALGLSGDGPWQLIIQAAPGAPTLRPNRGHTV